MAPTVLGAADAVQRARGDGDDLLPLQALDLARPADVVVGAVAQPVVVALSPTGIGAVSQREGKTVVLLQSTALARVPGVDGAGFGQRHGELRAALHFDHTQSGEGVDLEETKRSGCQVFDEEDSRKDLFCVSVQIS